MATFDTNYSPDFTHPEPEKIGFFCYISFLKNLLDSSLNRP